MIIRCKKNQSEEIKMKNTYFKKLALLLILVMGFSTVVDIKAEESEFVIINDVDEDTTNYDEINEYLIAHGEEVLSNTNGRSSVKLSNIKRLVQTDSRWSSEVMQSQGLTIGKAGCCLTSFTMVRNFISNVSETPATVNKALGNNACSFNWSYAENLYGYTALTKLRNDSGISQKTAVLNVVGAIDEYSRPAIIGLKTSSGNTHFVVAYGYTSDEEIIICDPASRNYTLLSKYFDEGYFVHRIYVYEVG